MDVVLVLVMLVCGVSAQTDNCTICIGKVGYYCDKTNNNDDVDDNYADIM